MRARGGVSLIAVAVEVGRGRGNGMVGLGSGGDGGQGLNCTVHSRSRSRRRRNFWAQWMWETELTWKLAGGRTSERDKRREAPAGTSSC